MLQRLLLLTIPAGIVFLFIGIASLFDIRVLWGALVVLCIMFGTFLIAIGMTIAKWKHKIDAFKAKWMNGSFLHKK